ncbi:hypothetical protein RKD33_007831 [Streptomyces sp. SAI-129]
MNADGSTESGSLIDEIVREGARRMLAAVLEVEVNQYIAELTGERDGGGHRLMVRNGRHRPRTVVTAAGPVGVAGTPAAAGCSDRPTSSSNSPLPSPLTGTTAVDAAQHGWSLMFSELHPNVGGRQHYAAYLESTDDFEVELVAINSPQSR